MDLFGSFVFVCSVRGFGVDVHEQICMMSTCLATSFSATYDTRSTYHCMPTQKHVESQKKSAKDFGDFGDFGTFWLILAHFGTFWHILANFGTFWYILVHFGNFDNFDN